MKFRKPMLAKNYEGNEHRVIFPCFAQPKHDGIRCVTDGKNFWSKEGKLFPKINMAGLTLNKRLNHLIDGELFIPGVPFEDVVSAVKHASDDDRTLSDQLVLKVFDIMSDEQYFQRKLQAQKYAERAYLIDCANWEHVLTRMINDQAHLEIFAKKMLHAGHEGTIIRNVDGLYVPKKTWDLLKYKPLQDAEFEIIDVKEAKGKDKGTPVFICAVGRMKEHKTFRVRPMGTSAQRHSMWKNRCNLLGMRLTVEFQNYTKHGKPRFPRAKVLRDYE